MIVHHYINDDNDTISDSELVSMLRIVQVLPRSNHEHNRPVVAWPCLKLSSSSRLADVAKLEDKLFSSNAMNEVTHEYLQQITSNTTFVSRNNCERNMNPPVCILLGETTPFDQRCVFNFCDTSNERFRTVFPFGVNHIYTVLEQLHTNEQIEPSDKENLENALKEAFGKVQSLLTRYYYNSNNNLFPENDNNDNDLAMLVSDDDCSLEQ